MPPRINHQKIAQRTRKSTKQGSNRPAAGCKAGIRKKADTPRIVANSIFALTLSPKPALQVADILNDKRSLSEDNYDHMYADVLKIVQRSILLATDEVTTFNPLKQGFDLSQSFDIVLGMFKSNVMPKGWNYNIERTHGNKHYQLVIYEACMFEPSWHIFPIAKVVKKLAKNSPALHDMFVKFMANFYKHTKMCTWWWGGLSWVDEGIMEDNIENDDFSSEEERAEASAELAECIECYRSGDAKQYQELMTNTQALPVEELRADLSQFSKRNDLVKWMYEACDLMDQPYTLDDYIYPEQYEQEGAEGVLFDQQLCLIWDLNDAFSREQEQYLDSEVQGCGVLDPVYTFRLKTDLETLDAEYLLKGLEYPKQFTKINQLYFKATAKYE